MRYASYSEYQHSGISWLERIPKHWDVIPIKFSLAIPITDGPHETPHLYSVGVPFVSAEAIKNDKIDFSRIRGHISSDDHERYSKKYFPEKGDVYMVKSGATTGNVARVETDQEFNIWSPLAALRPDRELMTTDFLFFFMKSKAFSYSVELGWNYGTQQNIGMGVIANLKLALPPIEEQCQINKFLRYKTDQLDQLIAKKQALIERLNEQRIALITQAVTRGLNSDVPLKDSGVEWLGQVPEGWEVAKLRRCVSTVTSGSRGWAKYFSDSGDIFLRITNLTRNSIQLLRTDIQRVMPPEGSEGERTKTQPGDVLISITADLGSVAVIPDFFVAAYVSQHICLVRPERDKVLPEWLAMSVFSHSGRAQLGSSGYGGTKQQLSLADVKELVFTMPPTLKEQKDILEYVQVETEKTDRLVSLTVDTINRLEEYRTALITAAVTGKIDVRDIQIPATPNDGLTSENIHEKASSQA